MVKYKITVLYEFKENETHYITSNQYHSRITDSYIFYDEKGNTKFIYPSNKIIIKIIKDER
jgi:hypothetical protein